jgi:DNA-binding Xre family transcriptional regulator
MAEMDTADKDAVLIRLLPGSFAQSLKMIMSDRKVKNKKLADASLVGERTIQRLRNEEDYRSTKQAILGLCVGLRLSPALATVFMEKSGQPLNLTKPQDIVYWCVLTTCMHNSIYEINEMLSARGIPELGSMAEDVN